MSEQGAAEATTAVSASSVPTDVVVAVTGASGFVGSTCVKQLLEKGYTVHAVVRDPSNTDKVQFLKDMVQGDDEHRVQLFAGDLDNEGSFDAAFKDATYVIHTAASVALTARDPQREIVDRNVNGMVNVLTSCRKYAKEGQLKKVVVTSSVAAIENTQRPPGHVYTEDDYNDSADPARDPYQHSKYLSEVRAQQFVDDLSDDETFQIAFINPGAIYGPLLAPHHLTSSPQIIADLMTGKFPMVPQLSFPSVDVRDVATAHIQAMESDATGRFVCVENTYSMQEISTLCKEDLPQYVFPTRRLPNFLMYITALFDKRVTLHFCRQNLGRRVVFANDRIKKELGVSFIGGKESFVATAHSLLDLGLVERK
ncbi:dihydroflavonol reductase [Salpingoeca rosetta]|uniref:Dihydroflavonol reductase n=1 Tax=Salpingoeca rosetta (strain ATCC 50818 / BSB-021) TaxID=946362 RepID=F2U5A9_SALR5|nr:dihydroflavonol reductase [Salpingoeca rosetta]EGD83125.1 dihydroflavonol reductase [Salpingoeca rosetta]|eukprot:XP_004995489.1 dihydroflavonol reductase [Salpingoeca rosetta]